MLHILGIGQTYLDIVPISQSPGLVSGEEWLYEIGNSQYLIMPFRKSEALACHLLRTAIMIFLYKRAVIGIEYPELHVFHFRTLVGFICPSERY